VCARQPTNLATSPCDLKPFADIYNGTMQVTVYSAFWCPECREAKRFLQQHNIAFQEIDIENTPGAADEVVKRTGKRAVPQFVIDCTKKWPIAWE
jgi:glutaredoxin